MKRDGKLRPESIYLGQTPYEVVSTTYNGHDMTVQVRA